MVERLLVPNRVSRDHFDIPWLTFADPSDCHPVQQGSVNYLNFKAISNLRFVLGREVWSDGGSEITLPQNPLADLHASLRLGIDSAGSR